MIKYIADNVIGGIKIEKQFIFDLYQTKELKRLGRISQLGLVNFLYPTSTHNRLSHSLGVYEFARRFLIKIKEQIKVDDIVEDSVLAAAILHDVGHGPFSHNFEDISNINHEKLTIEIIKSNTEVNSILKKQNDNLPEEIIKIIKGKHEIEWVNQIISSEIDVDRLDYLLRDSKMTGLNYGLIDYEWIIKNIKIVDNKLVFDYKCLPSIEAMILGRYHMHQAVYSNYKNIMFSQLFVWFVERLKTLNNNGELSGNYDTLFKVIENKKFNIKDFIELDEIDIVWYIKYANKNEIDEHIKLVTEMFLKGIMPNKTFKYNEKVDKSTFKSKVKLKFDFNEYQSNKEKEAKILFGGKIESLREVSTIIKNFRDEKVINEKEMWVYIK